MCITFDTNKRNIRYKYLNNFNLTLKKNIMKKLILLAIVVFSIISCTKNEASLNGNLTQLTKEVLKQNDFATMQQAYQMLTNEEKKDLWEAKLETVLKNDKQNLSRDQYNIIVSINKFLIKNTLNELIRNPKIGEQFLVDNLSFYQKHFTKVELYMLLQSPYFDENFSIKNSILYAEKLANSKYNNALNGNSNLVEPPNNCECKYDLGCPGWNNTCEKDKGKCIHTTTGCGIFGTSECSGRCYLSPA
jgi:hypothetical protein